MGNKGVLTTLFGTVVLACTNTNPDATMSTPSTEQSSIAVSKLSDNERIDASLSSKSTIHEILRAGTVDWLHSKSCQIVDSQDESAPNGWFVYAWNPSGTIGLVVSIHRFSPADIRVGEHKTLDIPQRDAFVMVEAGQGVERNFCVRKIQEIPMVMVLESQGGRIHVSRTDAGLLVEIVDVSLKDQYSGEIVELPRLSVQTAVLERPDR